MGLGGFRRGVSGLSFRFLGPKPGSGSAGSDDPAVHGVSPSNAMGNGGKRCQMIQLLTGTPSVQTGRVLDGACSAGSDDPAVHGVPPSNAMGDCRKRRQMIQLFTARLPSGETCHDWRNARRCEGSRPGVEYVPGQGKCRICGALPAVVDHEVGVSRAASRGGKYLEPCVNCCADPACNRTESGAKGARRKAGGAGTCGGTLSESGEARTVGFASLRGPRRPHRCRTYQYARRIVRFE